VGFATNLKQTVSTSNRFEKMPGNPSFKDKHRWKFSQKKTSPTNQLQLFFYHCIILLKRQQKGIQYSLWTEVLPKKVNSPRALKLSTTDAWIGKIWGFKHEDSHDLTYEMTSSKHQTT